MFHVHHNKPTNYATAGDDFVDAGILMTGLTISAFPLTNFFLL